MRPPRSSLFAILPILALALAACGGASPASSSGGGGNSSIPANAASIAASAAASAQAAASAGAAASQAAPSSAASSGGGGGPSDLQSIADKLTPPHSTETGNLSTNTAIVVTYTSTDSTASLKSFYDKAIVDAGLTVVATTTAGDTYAWVLGNVVGGLGGSISVGPNPTGDGSLVSIGVGNGP